MTLAQRGVISFGLVILCVTPSLGEVQLSINDRFQIALTSDDEPLAGINIRSSSGSLLPGEADAAGPFAFAWPSVNDILFGNLGTVTVLNGERASLPVRWNPTGVPDVLWEYGVRAEPIGPFQLFGRAEFAPDPNISVTLNDQNRFVLSGNGAELIGIQFKSPSGSLLTGSQGDSGPFSVVYSNNANQLAYGQVSSNEPLTLDGSLTLPGGWNVSGSKDVTYHYNQVGAVHSGPIELPINRPSIAALPVSLNNQFQFVLSGEGQLLNTVSFASSGGSLLPGTSSAPFETLTANSPNRISFQSDVPVALDGEVTLDAGWNRALGFQDIVVSYVGEGLDAEFPLLASTYRTGIVRDPIGMRVNYDTREIEISGKGQELRSLQVDSSSGSLVHDPIATGPFAEVRTTGDMRVVFDSLGFVTLNGTLTVPVEFSVSGQPDLTYRYEQVGVVEKQGPFDAVFFFPTLQPIEAWIDLEGFFNVQGSGHFVESLDFRSDAGALIPGESTVPFESFESNSVDHVRLLGDVTLDGRLRLDLQWNESVAADVEFRYELENRDAEFGPFGVNYPSTNEITLLAAPSLTDRISLIGEGQFITAVELQSDSGSLILLDSLADTSFDIVEVFTQNRVLLRSTEGLLVRDEPLPVAWDPNGEADLRAVFEGAGARVIVPRYVYTSRGLIPEPNAAHLILTLLPTLGVLRRPCPGGRRLAIAQ